MAALTITITNIPDSEPGQHMADLIDQVLTCVDAPLEHQPAAIAAKAWIIAMAIIEQHKKLSGKAEIDISTFLGIIAISVMEPPAIPAASSSE